MNSVRQYVLGILIGLFIAVPIQAKTVDSHYFDQLQIRSLNNQFHYQSLVKAKALAIETAVLQLISEKNVDFLQQSSTSDGALTTVIENKGHQKETVIAATIEAENITLNGQNINEALTTANIEKQILRTLSSQDSLTQALKDQGIDLQALTANNKEWNDSMTTLSGVGQIVVQVVVAYFTAGAGNALVMGATEVAKQTLMQQALAAAVQSVVLQGVSQLATSAITGNAPSFDVASIIKGALVAGATAYAGSYINAEDGLGLTKGSFTSEAVNTVAKTGIDTAVNGGSFSDNLVNATIDTVGAKVASGIGSADLDGLTHKLAHAGLGCALGSAKGGDCASGAVGAVAAEIAGDFYAENNKSLYYSDREQFNANVKVIGELAAIGIAVVAGKDVQSAYDAGVNAVENNLLMHIPGTWSKEGDVNPEYIVALEKLEKEGVIIIGMNNGDLNGNATMGNNMVDREQVADYIIEYIKDYKFSPGEPLKIYGHSHGGNVMKLVSQKMESAGIEQKFDKVVFLATPHRNDYNFNRGTLAEDAKVINVYDQSDFIQKAGGNSFSVPLIGEIGPAKQKIKGHDNLSIYKTMLKYCYVYKK